MQEFFQELPGNGTHMSSPSPRKQAHVSAKGTLTSADDTLPRRYDNGSDHDCEAPSESGGNPLQLEFITITDRPAAAKAAYSHVVRSQAMQSFLRAKRKELAPNSNEAEKRIKSREVGATPENSFTKFKLSTWSRKPRRAKRALAVETPETIELERPEPISEPTYTSLTPLHPYGTLPIQVTDDAQTLLYHYNTSYTINSFALNPEGSWISFSFMDPGLLHATLGIVALHRDILTGNEQSALSLRYKGQAIHTINIRLKSGAQPVNDENLALVALLIKFETLHGTSDASSAHMKGLAEMIKVRGGLSCLTYNPILWRLLTWVDLLYCTRWGCQPCLVAFQPHEGPLATILKDISTSFTPSLSQYMLSPSMFGGDELIDFDTLETLQQISIAKDNTTKLTLDERKTVSHVIYLINHRLLMELSSGNDDRPSNSHLYLAFRVAAVLYLHLMIREIPSNAQLHYPLTKKLRVLIGNKFSGRLVESAVSKYAIWVIFLGAVATPPEETDNYFADLLSIILENLGIDEENGLRRRLRDVVWIGDVCDGFLSMVWARMRIAKQPEQPHSSYELAG